MCKVFTNEENMYFTWFVQNQHKGLTNHRKAHLIPRKVEHVDILDLLTVVMEKLAANLGKAAAWLQIKCHDKTNRLAEMLPYSRIK
jgi:hypothetical protein